MSDDYGKKIGLAFQAIYGLNREVSKLFRDCDSTIGKGKQSVFGNYVTKALSKAIDNPGYWIPGGIFRYYASKESPTLVEGLMVYYWDDPPQHDEPLLIVGQVNYRLDETTSTPMHCKPWDLWYAYFDWCEHPRLSEVMSLKRAPTEGGRVDWLKVCAVPLYSVTSTEQVTELLNRVRQAPVAPRSTTGQS